MMSFPAPGDAVRLAGVPARLPALVYYQCPHNPARPKDTADHPGHPSTVKAPELRLDQITGLFFAEHVFGPRRAELLAAQLPATDADAAADRDARAAALQARIRQLDTAQNAQILSLEQLSPDPADTAAAAMRAGITDRFAELHHERAQAQAQLDALAAEAPKAADPALLDQLPLAGDILPGLDPAIKARLFDAFDLQILWNKPGRQATVHAEITEATLRALPALLNPGQDGYDDTAGATPGETADVEDLFESPITGPMFIGPVEPDPELLIPAACGAGETSVARPALGLRLPRRRDGGVHRWEHVRHPGELRRRRGRVRRSVER